MTKKLHLTPLDKIKGILAKQEAQMAELRKLMGRARSDTKKRMAKS
jgi:hypothetical protein